MPNGKKFAFGIIVALWGTLVMGSMFLAIFDAIRRIGGQVYNYPQFVILALVALYTAGAVLRGEASSRKSSLIFLEVAGKVTGIIAIQVVTCNTPLAGWFLLMAIVGGIISVLRVYVASAKAGKYNSLLILGGSYHYVSINLLRHNKVKTI